MYCKSRDTEAVLRKVRMQKQPSCDTIELFLALLQKHHDSITKLL
jgi:hypothetical protein